MKFSPFHTIGQTDTLASASQKMLLGILYQGMGRVNELEKIDATLIFYDAILILYKEEGHWIPSTLRMSTCPPLAVDRLIGLAGVSTTLVKTMELQKKLPARFKAAEVNLKPAKIATIIEKPADPDIFVWLPRKY
jgi:XamI restriction endonuclease